MASGKQRRPTIFGCILGLIVGTVFLVMDLRSAYTGRFDMVKRHRPDLLAEENPILFWMFFSGILSISLVVLWISLRDLAKLLTRKPWTH